MNGEEHWLCVSRDETGLAYIGIMSNMIFFFVGFEVSRTHGGGGLQMSLWRD